MLPRGVTPRMVSRQDVVARLDQLATEFESLAFQVGVAHVQQVGASVAQRQPLASAGPEAAKGLGSCCGSSSSSLCSCSSSWARVGEIADLMLALAKHLQQQAGTAGVKAPSSSSCRAVAPDHRVALRPAAAVAPASGSFLHPALAKASAEERGGLQKRVANVDVGVQTENVRPMRASGSVTTSIGEGHSPGQSSSETYRPTLHSPPLAGQSSNEAYRPTPIGSPLEPGLGSILTLGGDLLWATAPARKPEARRGGDGHDQARTQGGDMDTSGALADLAPSCSAGLTFPAAVADAADRGVREEVRVREEGAEEGAAEVEAAETQEEIASLQQSSVLPSEGAAGRCIREEGRVREEGAEAETAKAEADKQDEVASLQQENCLIALYDTDVALERLRASCERLKSCCHDFSKVFQATAVNGQRFQGSAG